MTRSSFYVFATKLLLSEETALCLGKPACHWLKPSLPCKETAELEPEPNLLSCHNEAEKLMRWLPRWGESKRKARMSPLRKVTPVGTAQCPWRDAEGARDAVSAAALPSGSFQLVHVGLSLTINWLCVEGAGWGATLNHRVKSGTMFCETALSLFNVRTSNEWAR